MRGTEQILHCYKQRDSKAPLESVISEGLERVAQKTPGGNLGNCLLVHRFLRKRTFPL